MTDVDPVVDPPAPVDVVPMQQLAAKTIDDKPFVNPSVVSQPFSVPAGAIFRIVVELITESFDDPTDTLWSGIEISEDGGKTWVEMIYGEHPGGATNGRVEGERWIERHFVTLKPMLLRVVLDVDAKTPVTANAKVSVVTALADPSVVLL